MNEIISSFSLVAIAEIGDKTQLLSILLAAKFRKFWPIFFGVTIATLLNHAGAAYIGKLLSAYAAGNILTYITSAIFIVLGLWILIPDKEPDQADKEPKYGAFITSLITFFIAEMGDKTQFATITLGAQYDNTMLIVIGTTLGMLAANIPAILFGEKIIEVVPLKVVRITASILFVGYGLWTISHLLLG
jgi:putative Ca2+/H+ antiporter (TMEM165/GDT1 family)